MSTMESLPAPQEQITPERPVLTVVGRVALGEDLLPDVAVSHEDQQLFGD